ncbi:DUF2283 domain-containing protein [Nodosilinea sp. PGN35]|uniref:DUF2283 domain-containing protein n=1 Tax=Nodosilinea sp. PGN35 TaxID=3020489 RepID=UPI0023B2DC67|nr:DUF2283 domain-containing protein [Nodosilinea sp. TSF1-S3]MDF0369414.1 DUF2283 domain-containing protein [Nodosilinea sp. TSF1-S3]
MKFHSYPETDSLYISLLDKPSVASQEVASGIVLDFDAEGHLAGLDIDHASQVADLSKLEANALPIASLTLAGQSFTAETPA